MTLFESFRKQNMDSELVKGGSLTPEYWPTSDQFMYIDGASGYVCYNSLVMYLKKLEDRVAELEDQLDAVVQSIPTGFN